MTKFSKWLENKVRGVRAVGDSEIDQILRGEPYTSPLLGRIGFISKSTDEKRTPGEWDYLRGFAKTNQFRTRKPNSRRGWIIDLEIPEDEARERARRIPQSDHEKSFGRPYSIYAGDERTPPSAVDFLDPKHVKKIRRVRDNPDDEKPRDAEEFARTFRRLFPSFESYILKRTQ